MAWLWKHYLSLAVALVVLGAWLMYLARGDGASGAVLWLGFLLLLVGMALPLVEQLAGPSRGEAADDGE